MAMNVDESATETWVESTDGFERVRAVLRSAREPASAVEIAEQAHVSETTARKHLGTLADLEVATTTRDNRTTRYARNEEYHLVRRVQQLQREHTRRELADAIEEMKTKIREFRERYGVESPEELAIELDADGEGWDDRSRWEGTRRNLALTQTALSYRNARDVVEA